jgi:hypothetical protein
MGEVVGMESVAAVPAPYVDAVNVLAQALDRLGARIHRDLHVESMEGAPVADPQLAATLAAFSAYADDCLEVLDDARVLAVLRATRHDGDQAC